MLIDIVEATPLEGYNVRLRFEDGVVGDLDLSTIMQFEGVFAPLKDLPRFRRASPEFNLFSAISETGAFSRRSEYASAAMLWELRLR